MFGLGSVEFCPGGRHSRIRSSLHSGDSVPLTRLLDVVPAGQGCHARRGTGESRTELELSSDWR